MDCHDTIIIYGSWSRWDESKSSSALFLDGSKSSRQQLIKSWSWRDGRSKSSFYDLGTDLVTSWSRQHSSLNTNSAMAAAIKEEARLECLRPRRWRDTNKEDEYPRLPAENEHTYSQPKRRWATPRSRGLCSSIASARTRVLEPHDELIWSMAGAIDEIYSGVACGRG